MNFINSRKGFTMIEMLCTLFALSLLSAALAGLLYAIRQIPRHDYEVEDEIAVSQLQFLFAQGQHFQIENHQITMQYHGDEVRLEVYEDKIVKRPGFEVFLQDVDAVEFGWEGACVYAAWQRDTTWQEAILGCE